MLLMSCTAALTWIFIRDGFIRSLRRVSYCGKARLKGSSRREAHFSYNRLVRASRRLLQGLGVLALVLPVTALGQSAPPCGTIVHFKPGVNLDGWTGGATFQEQDQSVAL